MNHIHHDTTLAWEHIVRAGVCVQNNDSLLHPAVEMFHDSFMIGYGDIKYICDIVRVRWVFLPGRAGFDHV